MVVSTEYELITFLVSIVLAVLIGLLYDFFRALRKCTKITLVWDVIMWISISILVVMVWFFWQNGEVRWYMVLGTFFTGIIYLVGVSKYVFFVLCFFMDKICRIFRSIFKFLLTPLAFLCKIIREYIMKANFKFSRKVEENYDEKEA